MSQIIEKETSTLVFDSGDYRGDEVADPNYVLSGNVASVYVVDGTKRVCDLDSKLLYNSDSYLKGCIDTKDDVDFYSFSLKSVMGYKQIEITLEDMDGYGYELTVYDQYGNQVGIGDKDVEGNVKLIIDSVSFDVNKYYIKVEGKENCKDIEMEVNEKYSSKLYQLYLSAYTKIGYSVDYIVSTHDYNATEKLGRR